ncbi:hypothetical protein OH76DRAFT_506808 [Lentinus brumalis]|uniref:Uncharacterized protein n=1 Tax=Lentinus brumalis TaxID=2498619 RepID=A0A371DAX1_9APHY|nr:hypothetical protein OH76DRAFT_506808 [Polyporus brumalis]
MTADSLRYSDVFSIGLLVKGQDTAGCYWGCEREELQERIAKLKCASTSASFARISLDYLNPSIYTLDLVFIPRRSSLLRYGSSCGLWTHRCNIRSLKSRRRGTGSHRRRLKPRRSLHDLVSAILSAGPPVTVSLCIPPLPTSHLVYVGVALNTGRLAMVPA